MSEKRISNSTATFMIAVAILIDLIQSFAVVTLFLPTFIAILAGLTFFLWFKLNGVSFNNPKKMLSFFGFSFLEVLPVVNALPGWTLAVILQIHASRKEDAARAAVNVSAENAQAGE